MAMSTTSSIKPPELSPLYLQRNKFFFEQNQKHTTDSVKDAAMAMTPSELFKCHGDVNHEFEDLCAVLDNESVTDENLESFFYFSLYCCHLLTQYHDYCGNGWKKKLYQDKAEALTKQLKNLEVGDTKGKQTFVTNVGQTFTDTWAELQYSVVYHNKFAEKVGLINLSRIVFVLSRLSLGQVFIVLEQNNLLDKLAGVLHRSLTAQDIIHRMSMLNGVMNALSVGMFGSRWLRNMAATFYFMVCPSAKAKEALPSFLSRFFWKINEKKGELLNDTIWTLVNGATNYQMFGMSATLSMGLTAGFMFFDIGVLLYLKHCDEQSYIAKQSEYLRDKQSIIASLRQNDLTELQRIFLVKRLEILDKQMIYNTIRWRQAQSTYNFQIFAALLLASGFSMSLLVASPIMIAMCYVGCLVAVSMLLNGGSYGAVQGIKAKSEKAEALGLDGKVLNDEYQSAQIVLALNLVKNAVVPALVLGTFMVCWEAGLALALAYIAIEGGRFIYDKIPENSINDVAQEPSVLVLN